MTLTSEAFVAKVNAVLLTLSQEMHDFVVAESAKHGAGSGSQDVVAIKAYVIAMTTAMGTELGMMAATLGQNGPGVIAATFEASFNQGLDQMRRDISAAMHPN